MMSYSPSNFNGIIVTGHTGQCGKTVACAGLAGVFYNLGFRVMPVKPWVFQSFSGKASVSNTQVSNTQVSNTQVSNSQVLNSQASGPTASGLPASTWDMQYFQTVLPQLPQFETQLCEGPDAVKPHHWQAVIDACNRLPSPYLLETPGALSSLMAIRKTGYCDATDLSHALDAPILLVIQRHPDLAGQLIPLLAYCSQEDVPVVGWLAVETTAPDTSGFITADWESAALAISTEYQVTYLGCIPHSVSISVPLCQQGNLIRNTECNIDLLPLQHALNLTVPIFG
ncbi:MAG: hypothetical protein AAGI66_05205 [Cyanobacteria bacterium P01_H01_bin.74]